MGYNDCMNQPAQSENTTSDSPASSVDLGGAKRGLADPWESAISRAGLHDLDAIRAITNIRNDLSIPSEKARPYATALLDQTTRNHEAIGTVRELSALLSPEDKSWLDQQITEHLDQIVKELPFRLIHLPSIATLLAFNENEHKPNEPVIKEVIERLLDSAVELSRAYRASAELGYPIEKPSDDFKLKLAAGLQELYHVDVSHEALATAIAEEQDKLIDRIVSVIRRSRSYLLKSEEIVIDATTSDKADARLRALPDPKEWTIDMVINTLARHGDISRLDDLRKQMPESEFWIDPEISANLYYELCSRPDFGCRALVSSTADLSILVKLAPPPPDLEERGILAAGRKNYLNPACGGAVRLESIESCLRLDEHPELGISSKMDDDEFRLRRFLLAAPPNPDSNDLRSDLERALEVHLSQVEDSHQLACLLHDLEDILQSGSPTPNFDQIPFYEAASRVGTSFEFVRNWLLRHDKRDDAEAAGPHYASALLFSRSAGEFFDWIKELDAGLATPFSLSCMGEIPTDKLGASREAFLKSRINQLGATALTERSSDRVGRLHRLEKLLGTEYEIAPEHEQVIYAGILSPMLQASDSISDRKECWREIERAIEFVRTRSGAEPVPLIVQETFSFMFAGSELRLEDMESFAKAVTTPIAESSISEAYTSLCWGYCTKDDPTDIVKSMIDLERFSGVPLTLEPEQVKDFCRLALISVDSSDSRIKTFIQRAGYEPDEDFLQEFVLDNPGFQTSLPIRMNEERLDRHFEEPKNRSSAEFVRLGWVFGCTEYYERRLDKLEGNTDDDSLKERAYIYTALCGSCRENSTLYERARKGVVELMLLNKNALAIPLSRASSMLAGRGDLNFLLEIVNARPNRIDRSGLYFYSFVKHASPEVTKVLWHICLQGAENDHGFAKDLMRFVVPRLAKELGQEPSKRLSEFLKDKQELHDISDLLYIDEVSNIPSLELREASQGILANVLIACAATQQSINEVNSSYPGIPREVFVQLWALLRLEEAGLERFEQIYSQNQSSEARNSLMFGIVSGNKLPPEWRDEVRRLVLSEEGGGLPSAHDVSQVLTFLTFSQTLKEDAEDSDLEILKSCSTCAEASERLREQGEKRLYSFLLRDRQPTEQSFELWQTSDNLTALVVYLAKLESANRPSLVSFMTEMLSHWDPPSFTHWKEWRYDVSRPEVKAQIGHIPEELRPHWTEDRLVASDDINLHFTPDQKGQRVLELLHEALSAKPPKPDSEVSLVTEFIGKPFNEVMNLPLAMQESAFRAASERMRKQMSSAVAFAKSARLPAIDATLEKVAERGSLPINTKTLGTLRAISEFLPDGIEQEPLKRFRTLKAEGFKRVPISDLLWDEEIAALRTARDELTEHVETFEREGTFVEFEQHGSRFEALRVCYERVQQASFARQVFDVAAEASALANSNESDEERTRALLERVQVQLTDLNQRAQSEKYTDYIESALVSLGLDLDLGARKVALLLTDHPEVMLQIGKYPLGCGSCKNYESAVGNNVAIASDMGDAHIKGAFILDQGRLPAAVNEALAAGDSDAALEALHPENVFNSSIARSIFKVVKTKAERPGVFVEDVYTPLVGNRATLTEHFETFASEQVAKPLGGHGYREGRGETLEVPASRSPAGQYEDRHISRNRRIGLKQGTYRMAGVRISTTRNDPELKKPVRAGEVIKSRLGRSRTLEERFDLRTLVFDRDFVKADLSRALQSPTSHIVAVARYDMDLRKELTARGFICTPAKVGYRIELPQRPEQFSSFEDAYFSRFSSKSRSTRRREFRRLQEAVDRGELTVSFDRGHEATDLRHFVHLYQREMGQKERGWVPLVDAIASSGGSLTQFIRMGRLGLFLKRSDEVIAGLLASRDFNGYSIDYQSSDTSLRSEYPQMSRFLMIKLMERSFQEGYPRMSFGVDTNLYGHHLNCGLLYSKVKQGFGAHRITKAGHRMTKIVDPSVLSSPAFMYSSDPDGALVGNVFFQDSPKPSEIADFRQLSPRLDVWVWENGEFVKT